LDLTVLCLFSNSLPCFFHSFYCLVVQGLKDGSISPVALAAETASSLTLYSDGKKREANPHEWQSRNETWAILAVNKFDSDRKRMSIVLRSPPELGSIPFVFCKVSQR